MSIFSRGISWLKQCGIKESYAIGYRPIIGAESRYDDKREYAVILPKKTEWYADPFLYEYEGQTYLFAEIMKDENHWRGVLGVLCLSKGEDRFTEVLSEDFHLSYPQVFSYKGLIYMLPETYSSDQLRLYKCVNFPQDWELEWTMLEGVHYVDTTLLFDQDTIFAETHDLDTEKNLLFEININKRSVRKIENRNGVFVDRRPGGGFFEQGNSLLHMLQHNDNVYGEYLHIAKVEAFNQDGLKEEEIGTLKCADIRTNTSKKFKRVHTYNRTSDYEVIDLLFNMVIPKRFLLNAFRSAKRKLKRYF